VDFGRLWLITVSGALAASTLRSNGWQTAHGLNSEVREESNVERLWRQRLRSAEMGVSQRRTSQRTGHRLITAVVTALTLISVASLSNVASATTSVTTSTYVLYVGHGIGVAATASPNTGCSEVFLTTDFIHWRNITPPLKVPTSVPKGTCLYVWTDAYFTSPAVGWLLARNGGSTQTILRHTLNGGRTWITQPGGDTGSNAGGETISFVNSMVGWRQQFGIGSNGNYALQRTLDGGRTWSTRSPDPRGWCAVTNDVFSSASVGFASAPWASFTNSTHLWWTQDGGVDWSPLTLPPPPSLARNARGFYGEPEFSGLSGVVPVDYPVGLHQAIYFYATHDSGVNWKLEVGSHLPIDVSGALTINPQTAAQTCSLDARATSGRVAIVTAASPATWWILQPGLKGATTRLVVTADGTGITTYGIKDLPATTGQADLAALNSNDALLTLSIPYGYETTYETSNGGVTWEKVTLPDAHSSASGVTPNCATAHLRISLGRSGVAAGHIGMYFTVKNVGAKQCELDGFPTVQMIGSSKGLVPTLVTFGSDYTVPLVSARVTLIKAGAPAIFMLGYADSTGYGTAKCPAADTLRITPPGDLAAQDLHVGLQPYGGGTIQSLVCGEIAVSPIMSLAAWKHIA
jgi:hypothetical protein